MKSIKNKVFNSLMWNAMEQNSIVLIQFILHVILARILMPKAFGIIAIASIFITLSNIVIQHGFSTALVQKKEIDDIDLSSVLYLSLCISILLYFVIFFVSPYVSVYFSIPELTSILRVLSLILIPGAFNSVQLAIVKRRMLFRLSFIASLIAVTLSGIVSLIFAYMNYGVWAIVAQQLVYYSVFMFILSRFVSWNMKIIVSLDRIKGLFSFGWKVLLFGIIDELFVEVRTIVIGRYYSSSVLAFYNRGQKFPNLFIKGVNNAIRTVLLPVMAQKQDDTTVVKLMLRRTIKIGTFITFPVMVGLAVIAKPLVSLILTDKWLPSVFFLQVYCFIYGIWSITTPNLQALYSVGRSDLVLKTEIIRKCLDFLILLISMQFGVRAIALGAALVSLMSFFIYVYPNARVLEYKIPDQMKDIFPSLLLSAFMGVCISLIKYLPMSNVCTIVTQLLFGGCVYFCLARVFRMEEYNYFLSLIKKNI